MIAQRRFVAASICLLLAQSIGSFWVVTGFAQTAPAAGATAQELPGRALPAVPDELLIIFRNDAPPEDFARVYGLTHVYSYSDALIGKTIHHYRISNPNVPIAAPYRMRSTSPRSDRHDGFAKEKIGAPGTAEYISLLSNDPRIESVQPNYLYEQEDDFLR
jgi:hypothetical protein